MLAALSAALLLLLGNRLHRGDGASVPLGKKGSLPDSPKALADQDTLVPLARGTQAGQEWDGNALKMKCCWCPPGKFTMGSPKNEPGRAVYESRPVEVTLTQGFWMGKYEVTQDEWERVMGTRPSRLQGAKTLPVENFTWGEATRFCAVLTDQERARGAISAAWEFRLPTEAQWEYACRAGTTTAYSFGATTEGIRDYMWYGYNSDDRTHEVGGKKPNAWGLHDMHGKVWEWCRDWFQNQLPGGTDPEVKEVGTGRVFRGGGWNASAELCRTAFRSGQVPDEATHRVGFRVAVVQVATP
jgi:formylglycine-generating enzyme required for sulfatase activity